MLSTGRLPEWYSTLFKTSNSTLASAIITWDTHVNPHKFPAFGSIYIDNNWSVNTPFADLFCGLFTWSVANQHVMEMLQCTYGNVGAAIYALTVWSDYSLLGILMRQRRVIIISMCKEQNERTICTYEVTQETYEVLRMTPNLYLLHRIVLLGCNGQGNLKYIIHKSIDHGFSRECRLCMRRSLATMMRFDLAHRVYLWVCYDLITTQGEKNITWVDCLNWLSCDSLVQTDIIWDAVYNGSTWW